MKERGYCSFCGKKLILKTLYNGSREKYCEKCDYVFFLSPFPSVIVMVTNANKVLLVRAVDWKHPYWGLISGFVRLGETAEEAAVREVHEEVSLKASNLEFLKTYALEARDLLMLAFKVQAEDSSIRKSQELEAARWFDLRHPLPMRPESIAARIVQHVFSDITFLDLKELEKQLPSKRKREKSGPAGI